MSHLQYFIRFSKEMCNEKRLKISEKTEISGKKA